MKHMCKMEGIFLDPQKVGLNPAHVRFTEAMAGVDLTAEIEFDEGESAQFEAHDFTHEGKLYRVRVEQQSNGVEVIWARNGTCCTSVEITETQLIEFKLIAEETDTNGNATGNELTSACRLLVRPKGRPA